MAKKKTIEPTLEEKLEQALVPNWDEPYKLPDNWCWTTMDRVAQWGSGGTPSRGNPDYFGGSIPWVKTGELNDDYIFHTEETLSDDGLMHSSAKLFPINTVVIAMYGATVGKVGILGIEAATNQACACGKCSSAIDYKFLFYYARSQKDVFIDKARGGAQLNISQEIIKSHPVPLPPIAEQERIVDRIESLFSKLDEAIEKAQIVIDSFETRKAAILHKAFTGELTANWREEHGAGIDSWEKVTLSNVCKVNPQKINTKDLPDDLEVSFFPMPALSEVYGEITQPQTRLLKDVRTGFTNFVEGDVVFAKITPCMENGKSAVIGKLVNGIGFGTTEFFVLRCSDKLYNRFLYHIVRNRAFRDKAKAVMTGAVGQQRVPKSFLEEYPINLPMFEEQFEIVRIVDKLFDKEQQVKDTAEMLIEKVDLMKKSILARAFRGELGTNDPNDENAVKLLKRVLTDNNNSETKKQKKRTVIPAEISSQLSSELERQIIRTILKNNGKALLQELLSINSNKFDLLEAVRKLEKKEIIICNESGEYTLKR